MEIYFIRNGSSSPECSRDIPETWLDWVREQSTRVVVDHWMGVDPYSDTRLASGLAAPFRAELESLATMIMVDERKLFVSTCGQLPKEPAIQEGILLEGLKRRLAKNQLYLTTLNLLALFDSLNEHGGELLIAGD